MDFRSFSLIEPLMRGVDNAGYTSPTPIQSLAIPPALSGNDIIGLAQTGTGKTAAFVIPMLQRMAAQQENDSRRVHIRALVLTPTRELAQQVKDAASTYGRFLNFRTLAVYGGVGMENQLKLLKRGVDIVVATPGRLMDHLQRRSIDLSHVEILVLDEADRMLDMGFIDDVRKIVSHIPDARQTMLFSATMPEEIKKLTINIQKSPQTVEVGERRSPAETIVQHFYAVQPFAKLEFLHHVLETETMESVLVFSRTKHGADKIARWLERKHISTATIHSNKSQSQRQRALDGFKQGRFRVLVATDIAARGIDVDGISHVINFDTPAFAEDYIHRIGRTGRANATGDALTFVAPDERGSFKRIEKFLRKRLTLKEYTGFTPKPRAPQPGSPTVQKVWTPGTQRSPRHHESRPRREGEGSPLHAPYRKGPGKKKKLNPLFAYPPRKKKEIQRKDTFSMGYDVVGDESSSQFNSFRPRRRRSPRDSRP